MDETYGDFVARQLYALLWFTAEALGRAGVDYSLLGGSMIGALREGGIIPWDDDVDLCVLRAHYDEARRAIAEACAERDCPYTFGYNGRVYHVRPRSAPLWQGKPVTGLGLDLFVADEIPADARARQRLFFRLKTLQGMMKKEKLDWSRYGLKGKILVFGTRLLGLFRTQKSLRLAYDRLSARAAGCGSGVFCVLNDVYAMFDVEYRREWLGATRPIAFGDGSARVFVGAHEMLSAAYGDYLTPPPVRDRRFAHVPAY